MSKTEKKKWSLLKKIIVGFGVLVLVGVIGNLVNPGSNSDNNATPDKEVPTVVVKYHSNKTINQLITDFNKISDVKIAKSDVGQDFPYQVFTSVDGVNVRISNNGKNVFVDLSDETINEDKLKKYFNIFLKCFVPNLTPDQSTAIYTELQSGKYEFYNKYSTLGLEFGYLKSTALSDGTYSFKVSIEKISK